MGGLRVMKGKVIVAVRCQYFSSITAASLWLYRVSAAQDVVDQLILRLIHFLLNCPQTWVVIQPNVNNPNALFHPEDLR